MWRGKGGGYEPEAITGGVTEKMCEARRSRARPRALLLLCHYSLFTFMVLCEMEVSLCTFQEGFLQKCQKQGVFIAVAVYPGSAMSEDAAV
jgi:hypothetical protein